MDFSNILWGLGTAAIIILLSFGYVCGIVTMVLCPIKRKSRQERPNPFYDYIHSHDVELTTVNNKCYTTKTASELENPQIVN